MPKSLAAFIDRILIFS